MVASIRYWLKVFGLCQNDQPTWLGNYLFNDADGRDLYMEDLSGHYWSSSTKEL